MSLVELSGCLILVVDDTTENLDFLSEFLDRAGYRVSIALDGHTACERAAHVKPDLILLDVLMPDIDGFEVCKRLKANEATRDIPVIFMTALNETIDKLKGFEVGAIDFISKPYEPQELLARIKNHLTLNLLQEKLLESKQDLEKKVEERTSRLREINLDLEREVEERRKAEDRLKDALEKAEEASELKSAFLMMVSHEIRTPLNAILGFTNILLNEDLADKLKGYLNIIQESGESLLSIISDIIDLSLLETKKLQLYEEPVCLKTIFARQYYQIENFRDRKDKAICINEVIDKSMPTDVLCDPFRLSQVLNNLLVNAVKFTNEGLIEFGVKLKDEMLEFYVKDTGKGVPEEKCETVFDSFRQVDMSDSREVGGLGLGLAICRELVSLMGGSIWLESSTGKMHGTTVFFSLPFKPVKDIAETIGEISKKTSKARLDGRKILLVEDDPSNQKWIKEVLSYMGADIIIADNGEEGVSYFEHHKDIDIILMDIQLPVMNGYEAVTKIRELEQGKARIPIVALTAAALQEDRQRCMNVGCDAYIPKPVKKEDLVNFIEEMLEDS